MPGKKEKFDVSEFTFSLSANIYELHQALSDKSYAHAAYKAFKINDPKPRDIHKAIVRDRLLHHAIHRILYFSFDRTFIFDSKLTPLACYGAPLREGLGNRWFPKIPERSS